MKKALLLLMFVPLVALAQAYPNKPVRLIVGFPAGGPADIFGRALAQGMAAELGQPVIVENISGVGGVLGVDRAAKAAPDGYTLCINSASPLVIAPYSLSKIPICTWPPSRSFTAGAAPLYGTCTMSILASAFKSSPARWVMLPLPAEPKLTLPGLAFA